MRSILLVFISIFLSLGADFWPLSAFGQLPSANICEDSEVLTLMKQPQFFQPLGQLASAVKDADVFLVGEIHYSLPGLRRKILQNLASTLGPQGCLLYELPKEKSIQQHLAVFHGENYELVLEEFLELHQAARDLNLFEFTIDAQPGLNWEDSRMALRNQTMAQNILDLQKNAICSKSILFVGKAHLTEETTETRTLLQILRKSNLKIKAINLQDSEGQASIFHSSIASWNGVCSNQKELRLLQPTDPVIFESGRLPSRLVFNPRSEDLEPWTIFDWTILAKYSQ